jgi:hypothetical protein
MKNKKTSLTTLKKTLQAFFCVWYVLKFFRENRYFSQIVISQKIVIARTNVILLSLFREKKNVFSRENGYFEKNKYFEKKIFI